MQRIDARLGVLPRSNAEEDARPERPAWQVGDRAIARSGWDGTIAELDEERGRAVLEVSGMRVDVKLDELQPTVGGGRADAARTPQSGRRGDFGDRPQPTFATGAASAKASASTSRRARGVASSLDLRGARVDEALAMLDQYLDDAAHAGAGRVTVVHGHGTGAMRDAVRRTLGDHALVREWRPGDRGEGGDGATVVSL
jgi:DNA mismatch repair protein MutS2